VIPFSLNWLYAVFTFEAGPTSKPLGQLDSSETMKGEQLMLWTIVVVLLVLFLIGVLH